jgi:hypothetical protein
MAERSSSRNFPFNMLPIMDFLGRLLAPVLSLLGGLFARWTCITKYKSRGEISSGSYDMIALRFLLRQD